MIKNFFFIAMLLIAFSILFQGCYFFCFLKADKEIEQAIEGFLEEKILREEDKSV